MARRSLLPLLILAGALLAACGQQPAAQAPPTAAPPQAPPATEAPTAPPPATEAPTAPPPATEAPTAPPPATEAPTAPTPALEAPSVAAASDGPFAGIPLGRTAEGYQVLGSPDAQATLVMYSDFL